MKSVFDSAARQEIINRVNTLTPATQAQWGKMTVAQMMAHCAISFLVPAGEFTIKRTWVRFIGRFFKSLATNDKPFQKNSPTAAEFIITDERVFEAEKKKFIENFQKVSRGPEAIVNFEHGFFGYLTAEEWGKMIYKHTDHHLRQFGV